MRIRKATNKDIHRILELEYHLGHHMETIYLEKLKRLKLKKRTFYKRFKDLTINGKALLSILLGKSLDTKKQRFDLKKLEVIFNEYCKFLFLKVKNFLDVVSELQQKGFITKDKNVIKLKVPYEEMYPIRERLREELYVKHLSRKKKLKKGKLQIINLVVEDKGKILGYLEGSFVRHNLYGEGELSKLVVSKEARGKGVGLKLVEEFLKICKDNKVDYVQVTTSKENKEAIRFYKKAGFKRSKQVYLYWQPYKW